MKFVGVLLTLVAIAFGVVWVTGIGFHETTTPTAASVSIEQNPPLSTLPQGVMVISAESRPACSRLDRNLEIDNAPSPNGAVTLTVKSYTVKKYIPIVQRCSDEDSHTVITTGNRSGLPHDWFLTPGSHKLNVIVNNKPNVLTFKNDAGKYSLTKVSGDSVIVSSNAPVVS